MAGQLVLLFFSNICGLVVFFFDCSKFGMEKIAELLES